MLLRLLILILSSSASKLNVWLFVNLECAAFNSFEYVLLLVNVTSYVLDDVTCEKNNLVTLNVR